MQIQEANGLTLRPALDVLCGLDESTELPANISATNILSAYSSNAKITEETTVVRLMDLAGSGFLNDGQAVGITTGTIGGKYGFISSSIADSSGNLANPVVLTFSSTKNWDFYTIQTVDIDGNEIRIDVENPTWSGGSTSYTISKCKPNQRLRITGIILGKSWRFNKDTLISLNATLRSVDTKVDSTELQMSEVEIKAYEPNDYSQVIGRLTKGAPIWLKIGYFDEGDTSALMKFYLSDTMEWQDKTLTIKGADATLFIDDDFDGIYQASTYANVRENYFDILKGILEARKTKYGIKYNVVGEVEHGSGSTASNIFLPNKSKRVIIANAVNLYRNTSDFAVGYVDAGVPTLYSIGSMEEPASASATNINTTYSANAKFLSELDQDRVMDLAGTGFLNDGGAEPITSSAITGKYGYISEVCGEDGKFINKPTLTLTANFEWSMVAINIANKDGNVTMKTYTPTWSGSSAPYTATIVIDSWLPNERAYILDGIFGVFWSMSDDDCSDFKTNIDLNTNSISSVLYTATIGTAEEVTSQEVEAGQQYWLDFSEPILPSSISRGGESTANGTFVSSVSTPYKTLFNCTTGGEIKVNAQKIILSSTASNNPYTKTVAVGGDAVELEDNMLFAYDDGNLTQDGIDSLLAKSNITYEFTYRGNPKIRPRDLVKYTKQNGETILMTIDTVSHEMEQGGFVSKITARKGMI